MDGHHPDRPAPERRVFEARIAKGGHLAEGSRDFRMTADMFDDETGIDEWEIEQLIERLTGEPDGAQVVRLEGVTPSAVKRHFDVVRRRLVEQDGLALCLDPTDAKHGVSTLRELVTEYAGRVRERAGLAGASDELVEFLGATRGRTTSPYSDALTARAYKNALCRLWKTLSEVRPAVLFGFHLDEWSATEREVLEHLVLEFFSDPVAEFVPELAEPERFQGRVVFVDSSRSRNLGLSEDKIETIDVSTPVRESLREVLSSDNVVDRFLASTGGDPKQLDALLASLPSDCEHFWQYRYQQLGSEERRLVELIGVARHPLSIECLRNAVELIEPQVDFSAMVRRLSDEGFVEREIEAGTVRLQLADGNFRRSLIDHLDEERRHGLHLALAEAALGTQLEVVDDRFLAYHFLEADEIQRGFEFGMSAARRLHGEHSLPEARDLFETLLEAAEGGEQSREIRHYLIDIEDALGNYDRALEQVRVLVEAAGGAGRRAQLRCKQGELYVRKGRYEQAEEKFEQLTEAAGCDDEVIRAAAVFGRAESQYLQGNHAEAEPLVDRAVESLEECVEQESAADMEAERTLVKARNLQGKLALYRGDLEAAHPLFASNYALAGDRGLKRERSRAEMNLAVVDLHRGNYAEALETLEELRQRTPGPAGAQRAALLINLGMAAQQEDDYESAIEHYRAALREAKRDGYQEAISMAAYNLATAMLDLGGYERLLQILDRLEREQLAGRHLFMGTLPESLRAKTHIERDEPGRALEVLDEIEVDEDERVSEGARADVVLNSAYAHARLGQIEHARGILEEFDRPDEATTHYCLEGDEASAWAAIHLEEGEFERAVEMARRAEGAFREAGYNSDWMRVAATRVRALRRLGREAEALSILERRLTSFREHAERIPSELRDAYFQIPALQTLVRLNRELSDDDSSCLDEELRCADRAMADGGDGEEIGRGVLEGEADGSSGPERDSAAFRRWRSRYAEIVGEDARLHKIFRRIDQVASSDSPVLIQGESGTGKELVAEAVHREATDADESFVKLNCGAFVDNLLLSELFGHEKGAFTGAVEQKVGRFERADGGTIFLDEIGEMSQKAQVALLRVLQEGEFERVGGTETRSVDVRVICATNRNLETMVERGAFRLDLYYRLKGVLLELPPLRERRQDIPRLVRHFAEEVDAAEAAVSFQREVLEFLAAYSWPGNVRELKNFVRSILLFVEGEEVTMEHLRGFRDFFAEGEVELEAPNIDYDVPAEEYEVETPEPASIAEDPEEALVEEIVDDGLDLAELKERIEHQSIRRALKETGGNITRAAEILQMTRPRLSQIVNADEQLVELKEELVG